MLKNKTYRFITLVIAVAFFTSCNENSDTPEIEAYPDEIRLHASTITESEPVEGAKFIIEAKKNARHIGPYYTSNEMWLSELYLFVAEHFDSVSKKKTLKKDHLWGILEWEQSFETGVIYRDFSYPEQGSGGELHTSFKDKQQFLQVFGSIIEIPDHEDYISHGWNHDSTRYEPVDKGAGCYYEIESDTAGYYMTWYCGC